MCGSGLIPGSTLLTTFFPSLSFSSRALPDSIPCIRFKDCSLYMVQRLFLQEWPPSLDWGNNMVGGKHILGEEDTAHTLLIGEQLVLGRRTTFKEKIYMVGWVDGWMAGWMIPTGNIATLWLHLARWNLLDSQLSWVSKMEPSVAIKKDSLGLWAQMYRVSKSFNHIACGNILASVKGA